MTFVAETLRVRRASRNGIERDGGYVNERNATETVTVSMERARALRDDLDELLEDEP